MKDKRFINFLIYQYVIMILTPTLCAIFMIINPYWYPFYGSIYAVAIYLGFMPSTLQ